MNENLRPCGRCGQWFPQTGGMWLCPRCIESEAMQTIWRIQWIFLFVAGSVIALIVWMLSK